MKVNTKRMTRRLTQAPKKINRMSRNAVNDAARELAKETPEYLSKAIDNPTPFTVRKSVGRVNPSKGVKGGDVTARLYIADAQARYLSRAEHGEEAENYHEPVGKLGGDKRGNVKRRFYRTDAALRKLQDQTLRTKRGSVGKYFVGKPRHLKGAVAGIWQRMSRNKQLRLITVFKRRKKFKPKLGMRDEWGRKAPAAVQRHFEQQRKHPANRL